MGEPSIQSPSIAENADSTSPPVIDVEEGQEASQRPNRESQKKSTAKRKRAETTSKNPGQRSWVWQHYDKKQVPLMVQNNDGVEEQRGLTTKVFCKYCNSELLYSSANGTSSLAKHLEQSCVAYPGSAKCEAGSGQTILGKDEEDDLSVVPWSKERCVEAATVMVILDEMSFCAVERPGFRYFCKVAIPKWKNLPSRKVITKTMLNMYEGKKQELRKELSTHSVSLTTDTWTSVQNINYMVLTAHFIDDGWNMHKRVLNFCQITNHQGTNIGKMLEQCIRQWGIEKVLTISVDNASANKVAIDYVRRKLIASEKQLLMGGKFLHVRCLAHIVNLIVRSGLTVMETSVASIRNAVRYVRSSSSRLDVFKKCVEKESLEVKKVCVLDVPTRWNSTYLMLETAIELRDAFDYLAEEEAQKYLGYFDEEEPEEDLLDDEIQPKGSKRIGPPREEHWENAAVFVKFLKIFFDVTNRVSVTKEPSAPKAFHDIAAVHWEIEELSKNPLSLTSHTTDYVLHDMARKMKTKYKKYFGRVEDINQLFLVALVLDPRYKMQSFGRVCKVALNYDDVFVKKKMGELKELIVGLVDAYSSSGSAGSQSFIQSTQNSGSKRAETSITRKGYTGKMAELEEDWDRQLESIETVVVSSEVDRYLLDAIEKPPKNSNFKLLIWWKVNGFKYPTLQLLAKDVLAIQVSTVASESCFSTGKRVIDPHRSSLTPKSVEALICLQNWLKSDNITNLSYEPTPEEYAWLEDLETEQEQEEREQREKMKSVSIQPKPPSKQLRPSR